MRTGQSSDELTEVGGGLRSRVAASTALVQGDSVGRYVVMSRVGAGGMGVVYAAYDPELDRKVALKLLHAALDGDDDEAAKQRLLREAQAMAKLSHPHVIGVHDVGEHEGRVYLAMEFVEGLTLEAWRNEKRRRVAEVLEVFMAAGRGLAAAHSAQLVHRDFKPDNVMVGIDGRVRVMDFGLARPATPTPLFDGNMTDEAPAMMMRSGELTHVGSIIGTPAYMAPEQHTGLDVGPAADQFAFCVALWEALYGQRPFRGSSLAELAANVCAGERRPPPVGKGVPAWLRRVCERGLSPEPERRFEDMPALLVALERGRSHARRRTIAAGVGVVAIVFAAGYGYDAFARARAIAACEAEGASIAEVWNPDRQEEVRDEIAATRLSYAEATASKVMPWLDAQAQAWTDARTTACRYAEVDGTWDADLHDRARWCLDERRADFDALLTELGSGREATVAGAVRAASGLGRVEACLDGDLMARLPEPPADQHDELAAVRIELSRGRALDAVGDYQEGLVVVKAAVDHAEAIGWPPLTAEARVLLGRLHASTAAYEDAERELEAAYFAAFEAEATEVALDAAGMLVFVIAYRRERPEDAERWARHAEVLRASLPDPLHLHEIHSLHQLAIARYVAGDFPESLALHERVLALREETLGVAHPDTERSLNNLATVYEAMGDHTKALALMERSVASIEEVCGPDHPDVGMALSNLGNVYRGLRQYDRARAAFARSLSVRERALGPDHPDVAATLDNLGIVLRIEGDLEQARTLHERALAIFEKRLGPEHPSIAITMGNLSALAEAAGDNAQALELAERALAIRRKTFEPNHPHIAASLDKIATLQRLLGANEKAWEVQQGALAIWEKSVGPQHPYVAYSLVGLAESARGMKKPAIAVPLAERAVLLRSAGEIDAPLLAEARFVLARALYEAGQDRLRAVALAEQARDTYRQAGPAKAAALAEVEAWLEAHGPSAQRDSALN